MCVCVCVVDGVQQCVSLADCVHGSEVIVADLTIAFTGTSFDMDKFPDRTTRNGVTNGIDHLFTLTVAVMNVVWCSEADLHCFNLLHIHCSILTHMRREIHSVCILLTLSLPSSRQHLSYDVCLEVRGEIIRTVLCCIVY